MALSAVRWVKGIARGSVLLAGVAAYICGCDDASDKKEAGENSDEPVQLDPLGYPASCTGLHDKLLDCRLLKNGPMSCLETVDASEVCIWGCLVNSSCDTLEELYCGELYPDDTQSCVLSCIGIDEAVYICPASDTRIPSEWLCDGDADCPAGEDEVDCPVFQCATGDHTILKSWQCDLYIDCADASDEADCPDSFFCSSAQEEIITAGWVCDGDPDCTDGSDEVECALFTCAGGSETILAEKKCNLTEDCADGSDEEGCAALICGNR